MNMRLVHPYSRTSAFVALLPVLSAGCYTFAPTELGNAPLGTEVRALLSEPARQRLWSVVPLDRQYLDGKVIASAGDTLLLEVTIQPAGGMPGTFLQRIPVARQEILFLQTKQLNRRKTTMFGGVIAAAAVAVAVRILSGEAGGGAWPPVDSGISELVMWLRAPGPVAAGQRSHSP